MNSNVAIYCRLSKEDGLNESLSIYNQKKTLCEYVNSNNWTIVDIYSDDGYSGTNFNRPSFKRMIKDILEHKINVVVCKDLSRLGRNYLQVGYYLEEFFPDNNIRFIALSDSYDSINENEFIPFKNIINEWYAKDISKKVRFTLDNIAKNGTPRKTAFPLYGYKYNENNERVVDLESSLNVKNIFKYYLTFKSIDKVKEKLFKEQVYTPGYYAYLKCGYNYKKYSNVSEGDKYSWSKETITSILRNEEYLGHYITRKTKTKSYKNKERIKLCEDENYLFLNKYDRIIEEDLFKQVNLLLNSTGKKKVNSTHVYQGIIKCGTCKKNLMYHEARKRFCCVNKKCENRIYITCKELNTIITKELSYLKERISCLDFNDINLNNIKISSDDLEKRNEELKKYIKKVLESNLDINLSNEMISSYEEEMKRNENEIKKRKVKINDILKKIELMDLEDYKTLIFNSIEIKKVLVNDVIKKHIKFYYNRIN